MAKKLYINKQRAMAANFILKHVVMKKGKNGLYRRKGLLVDIDPTCHEDVYQSPDVCLDRLRLK